MGILLFPFVRMTKRGLLLTFAFVLFVYAGKNYWKYSDDRKVYTKYVAATAVEKKIKTDSTDKAKRDSIAKSALKDSTSLGNTRIDSLSNKAKADTLTKEQENDKGAWEGRVSGMKYDPKKDVEQRKEMRKTSYGKLWDRLLPATQEREAAWTYQTGIWDFAAMILLGMALLKLGFFNAVLRRSQYLLIAIVAITAGLLLGWFRLHNYQHVLQDYAKYIDGHALPFNIFFPFELAFLAFGYTSLVLFLIGSGTLNRVGRTFACVGQMALTNYILQSIACTLFFLGFGMGYYGRLSQYQLYIFVGELTLVQIGFSILWMRYYHCGPAEWLLRCLVYKKFLPNRIKKTDIPESTSLQPSIKQ